MRLKNLGILLVSLATFASLACSSQRDNPSYKDSVQRALEQADLKDVSVSEDRDKNTITLEGTLHSEDAKRNAGDVAKNAAVPMDWTLPCNPLGIPCIIK